jgi:hypothetical protein
MKYPSRFPHYAVIAVNRIGASEEHSIIGYLSEDSLRQLIAGACILAAGFCSREEAEQRMDILSNAVAA